MDHCEIAGAHVWDEVVTVLPCCSMRDRGLERDWFQNAGGPPGAAIRMNESRRGRAVRP